MLLLAGGGNLLIELRVRQRTSGRLGPSQIEVCFFPVRIILLIRMNGFVQRRGKGTQVRPRGCGFRRLSLTFVRDKLSLLLLIAVDQPPHRHRENDTADQQGQLDATTFAFFANLSFTAGLRQPRLVKSLGDARLPGGKPAGDRLGIGRSPGGLRLQAFEHQLRQRLIRQCRIRGAMRQTLPQVTEIGSPRGRHQTFPVVPGKRRPPGKNLTQHCSQRKHIAGGPRPMLLSTGLLGRHVSQRSQDRAVERRLHDSGRNLTGQVRGNGRLVARRCGHSRGGHRRRRRFLHASRQSPVHQLHFTKLTDHHVGRFDVTMNDALSVRVGHTVTQPPKRGQQRAGIRRAGSGCRPVFGQQCRQIATADQPQRHKRTTVRQCAQFVRRGHARMIQPACDQRFANKPIGQSAGGGAGFQRLDGHRPFELSVPGLKHNPHATGPDFGLQFITRFAAGNVVQRTGCSRRRIRFERRERGFVLQFLHQRFHVPAADLVQQIAADLAVCQMMIDLFAAVILQPPTGVVREDGDFRVLRGLQHVPSRSISSMNPGASSLSRRITRDLAM